MTHNIRTCLWFRDGPGPEAAEFYCNLIPGSRVARSFTGASPMAVSLVKQGVSMALAQDLRSLLASEADHQALCFVTDDHVQAVQRFLDKQPAAFQWPAPPSLPAR